MNRNLLLLLINAVLWLPAMLDDSLLVSGLAKGGAYFIVMSAVAAASFAITLFNTLKQKGNDAFGWILLIFAGLLTAAFLAYWAFFAYARILLTLDI